MSSSDDTSDQINSATHARFYRKVSIPSLFECWEWEGTTRGQYGVFFLNGHKESAHRVAWILQNGEIPDGLCVLHRCDNPLCVNPSHLFLGTQHENMQDKARKGRCNTSRGTRQPHAKLTDDAVREIRKLILAGYSHRYIGELFGVSNVVVSYIRNGKAWQHVK